MEKYKDRTLSPGTRARDLLERMTTAEKVGQLNQRLYGFRVCTRSENGLELSEEFCREAQKYGGIGVLYGLYRADPWSGRDYQNGLAGHFAVQAYNLVQEYVITQSRFGIPVLIAEESPHGHQALDGYLLPVNLAVGATWNPKLAGRAVGACARQMKKLGVDLALVSMLDVLRDARWGRCEECFGEDAYLAAQFAREVVGGYRAEGVDVVAKHFAAQGETTGGVNASSARIGERELREIHLPPAYAAVKAGAAGIMAAYNDIDGIPCHNNPWLLGDVLRGEMGFDGIVMADGVAVDQLGFLYNTPAECGAAALSSGVDVSLWDEGFAHLEEALAQGMVSRERLDEAAWRVLKLKFERGLFDAPYLTADGQRCPVPPDSEAYVSGSPEPGKSPQREQNRGLAEYASESLALALESAVLLKNEGGILPLAGAGKRGGDSERKRLRVALTGEIIRDVYALLGDYTPPVRQEFSWSIERGFYEVFARRKDLELVICDRAEKTAECDVTVLVLGGSSSRFGGAEFDINGAAVTDGGGHGLMDCGEGVDLSSLQLPQTQLIFARKVFAAAKRVVTIVTGGRPYALGEIAEQSDALLYAFYPGPVGALALAQLLTGEYAPSGRLPVSLPRSAGQLPVWYNSRISYEAMHYCDEKDGALYSFGSGMGYGDAEYQDIVVRMQEDGVVVSFTVLNPFEWEETAVPMVFLRNRGGSVLPRRAELKAFGKYRLAPGETKRGRLLLPAEAFAVWDSAMRRRVEPGGVVLTVRDGSRVLLETEIRKDCYCAALQTGTGGFL